MNDLLNGSKNNIRYRLRIRLRKKMYNNFRDMPVWKDSLNLSESIFKLTLTLPKSEDYGLTSQLRRSANSISANINPVK